MNTSAFWVPFLSKVVPPLLIGLAALAEDLLRWHILPGIERWKVRRVLRRELARRIRETEKKPDPAFATLHQYTRARRAWHAAGPLIICLLLTPIAWRSTDPPEVVPLAIAGLLIVGAVLAWRRWHVTHALLIAEAPAWQARQP